MVHRVIIQIVLASTLSGVSWSQSYNFIKYDIGDGLVHDKVLDLTEDKFGNLWIATLGGGLSRFDGLEFHNLTIRDGLASNYVRDIMTDQAGQVWAATARGISKFNGHSFKNYTLDTLNDQNNSVSVLLEGKNCIWFAAPKGGLGRLDLSTEEITTYKLSGKLGNDKIIAMGMDSKANLWIISVVNGLFRYNGDTFENVLSNKQFKGYLLSLYIDNDDVIWLGSNKGLLRFDPEEPSAINNFHKCLKDVFIKSAQVKNPSNFWGLSAFGVVQVDGKDFRQFGEAQGFTDNSVNTIYCDREGTVWAGTDGDGLYKLVNQTFVHYNSTHGLSENPITSVVKDMRGNYWFSTYGAGIDIYNGDVFRNISTKDGLANAYLSCSTIDKQGDIWFGTRGSGLIKYDGQRFIEYGIDKGLVYNTVRCIFNDSQNNLWIGTANGLSKYNGKSFENFTIENGLYDNTIWNIQEPVPGKILIVTRKGFNYFVDEALVDGFYQKDVFNKRINMALEDKHGAYWIGYSGHGVARYDKSSDSLNFITTSEGLTSDLIYNLIFDDQDNLVVGSERGVDKIFIGEAGGVEKIKNYGEIEGFRDIQTIHNSIFKDTNGDIWFGTSNGAYKYQPDKERFNDISPTTYISGLKLFYSKVDWSRYSDSLSNWFSMPIEPNLPYDKNSLVIEYFGNSLSNPAEVAYQFRLNGLEKNWSPVTRRSEAVYTNLSPGSYTFQVRAANGDGMWNEEPATFSFKIVPPFWLEPWFFAFIIILILIGIKLFNDYRIRVNLNKLLTVERIRAEELVKVRKRMARDFHDNMGNQLASITVFASLINLKLKDKSVEINELLQNIEKHTKSLFNGTKDFIWSIDPESDNLSEVFTYVKDFGEELFDKIQIEFYAETVGLNGQHIPLPSGWSRQIVLIFKEAMTNTLKHAQANEVYFSLNLRNEEFVIELKDNGKGLEIESLKKGNGFKNMRSRATQISCKLDVEARNNPSGTIIKLSGQIESNQTKDRMKIF